MQQVLEAPCQVQQVLGATCQVQQVLGAPCQVQQALGAPCQVQQDLKEYSSSMSGTTSFKGKEIHVRYKNFQRRSLLSGTLTLLKGTSRLN